MSLCSSSDIACLKLNGCFSLTKLAQTLLEKGPHKLEKTSRRVRGLYDGIYVFDTTEARFVWEHPYYPQFYIPNSAVKDAVLKKDESVDEEESAFLATLKGKHKSTDRVIIFEKGPLAGLVRFEFAALGKPMIIHHRTVGLLSCPR